ncbi:hypothetical protein AEAC466_10445 [Asticcacaulis sp. AC466]|uniref:glucoamylase family protein n=1 Tax=Asticcacaulis sp. AC466 TaxID=1282362 RepID=UPI0003C3B908|nr:glucoamylase family protein [Asticcacaulis sp. AC466]ESQ84157.1 hypothetical protein AEAC466_10445 [Asticcacaulis sp. AC466]
MISRRNLLFATGAVVVLAACAKKPEAQTTDFDPQLADLHRRTFDYFWETTDARTGLAPDNWPNPDFCSIAATGFALTAYCIGTKNGYVSRFDAAERTRITLRTFWNGPQGPDTSGTMGHKGFFYHFLHMDSGLRYRNVELSSIDTALLLGGVLTAAGFFDGGNAIESEIRDLARKIYERVDWTFMARESGLVSMGWHPESGMRDHDAQGLINRNWDRYNEGMIVYHLGMASPTHPLPAKAWQSWMASLNTWGDNYGEPHLGFAPMFGHQYSQGWYDYRGIADAYMRDKGIDYFINSKRATEAQRNYAIKNPGGFKDYGADIWGLTACRGPAYVKGMVNGREVQFQEYSARGPQTGDKEGLDDGTIAPTAAAGSVMFAPDICVPAIKAMIDRYGSDLYGKYGFLDAFNPSFPADLPSKTGIHTAKAGWVSNDYLGIDQGAILIGLENYRSGFVWDIFNRSATTGPLVRKAFLAAGFEPVAASGHWLKT